MDDDPRPATYGSATSPTFQSGTDPDIQMNTTTTVLGTAAQAQTLAAPCAEPNFPTCFGQYQSSLVSAAVPGSFVGRVPEAERDRLRAYADRFNARDFDALRDLLAEDVRLDLVSRTKLAGRKDVSVYFGRYDSIFDWRFVAGLADGRPALLGYDPTDASGAPGWVVFLDWAEGRIVTIRDFKYAPYVMESLEASALA